MKKTLLFQMVSLVMILNFGSALGQINSPITLSAYKANKFYRVVKVTSDLDVITIHGYHTGNRALQQKEVILAKGEVYGLWNYGFTFTPSIITVPQKIRYETGGMPTTMTSGLSNAGFNFELLYSSMERYFSNGYKSVHRFSAGIVLTPTAIELTPENTNNEVNSKFNQLFISSGISLNYSYNGITLSVIPLGFDIATAKEGKNWIYNSKPWFGFGIGIEPKFLAQKF